MAETTWASRAVFREVHQEYLLATALVIRGVRIVTLVIEMKETKHYLHIKRYLTYINKLGKMLEFGPLPR